MEEKLYFKPELSEKKKGKTNSKKDHRFLKLFSFLLMLLIIILVIIWLLRGKTTVSGQYPENVSNESLSCASNSVKPPKLSSIDSDEKELKINAVFRGTDELKSLSLIYTLNYPTEDEAYKNEAISHAELNESLSASGFSVSSFKNKFSRYDGKLIISLSINKTEINEFSAPFFLLIPD